jgi:hypothetical protein
MKLPSSTGNRWGMLVVEYRRGNSYRPDASASIFETGQSCCTLDMA